MFTPPHTDVNVDLNNLISTRGLTGTGHTLHHSDTPTLDAPLAR